MPKGKVTRKAKPTNKGIPVSRRLADRKEKRRKGEAEIDHFNRVQKQRKKEGRPLTRAGGDPHGQLGRLRDKGF